MNGRPRPQLELTRGWFHGWCQCGSDQLALTDVWPQLPFTKCAGCGRIDSHVLATYYALHDTDNGRHYISYRSMEWPFYVPSDLAPRVNYRAVWSRIAQRNRAGGLPS